MNMKCNIIFEIGREKLLSIFFTGTVWQQDTLIPTNLVGYTEKIQ